MNRIAILILVLILAALAILLVYRVETRMVAGLDPSEVRRQPAAALEQVETLIQQARDGAAAADQARETLTAVIESDPASVTALEARLLLVDLEQTLGNDEAAGNLLLDAITAHPGSEETPRLLFDLGLLLAGPLDRPDEAREVFKRVVHLYPDNALTPEATIRLARIRISVDTYGRNDLLSEVSEIIRANPNHPLADEALFLVNQFATEFSGTRETYFQWRQWQHFHEIYPDSPLGAAWPEPEITGPHIDPVYHGSKSIGETPSPKEADHE